MDYEAEQKRLDEGGSYWKPKIGKYVVEALTELEATDPFIKKKEGEEDQVTEQVKIKILVDGEEKTWTMAKGLTPASSYGQLVGLATKLNNTLKNTKFTIVVKNDGNRNDYTIV